jgi:hypothetical protein
MIYKIQCTKLGEEFTKEAADSMEVIAKRFDTSEEGSWVLFTAVDWPHNWKYNVVLAAQGEDDFTIDTSNKDFSLGWYEETFQVSDFFAGDNDLGEGETITKDQIPGITDEDLKEMAREGLIVVIPQFGV